MGEGKSKWGDGQEEEHFRFFGVLKQNFDLIRVLYPRKETMSECGRFI